MPNEFGNAATAQIGYLKNGRGILRLASSPALDRQSTIDKTSANG